MVHQYDKLFSFLFFLSFFLLFVIKGGGIVRIIDRPAVNTAFPEPCGHSESRAYIFGNFRVFPCEDGREAPTTLCAFRDPILNSDREVYVYVSG